jgi:alpha-galactosidase
MSIFSSCKRNIKITNGDLVIEFNNLMHSRISSTAPGAKSLMDSYSASEFIAGSRFAAKDFKITSHNLTEENGITTHVIRGVFNEEGVKIEKVVGVTVNPDFPGLALMDVYYINKGERSARLNKWVNNNYQIISQGDEPAFWSFQASSSRRRLDWITPLTPGFYRENYMGMNDTDYGGGIPAINIWRRDAGIMVGHVELVPKLVSLPVEKDQYGPFATMGVHFQFRNPVVFEPNDTLETFTTFVSVHQGDYFAPLRQYSELMQYRGIEFVPSEPQAFEPVWCAWGYERDFTMKEIIGTLPKVKELGITWVDIDDGFQIAEGDWDVDRNRFPGGNAEMRRLVNIINSYGLRAKLWWAPLAVDYDTELLSENPNILIRAEDGAPQFITWWNSFFMSPTFEGTRNHTREVLNMFINEWGFEGLKMDGQHLNCVAPNFNRRHRLQNPEEDNERLPEFFKMIYDEVRAVVPDAVIQNCPCGTAVSFYNIATMNQAVASDPTSSFQIRHKGRTFKAINPGLAYYGDHVELSDNGDDFATQFGIGAVLGTKFTWPENPAKPCDYLLTPEREVIWRKWFDLYNSKRLSEGLYLGHLYDIGYDIPETHLIQKGDILYYAFYADQFNGMVEFRGLSHTNYTVHDYVNDQTLGTVSRDNPKMEVSFTRNLLVALRPE